MASWTKQKNINAINNGEEFVKGQRVSRSSLNAIVNNTLHTQDFVDKLENGFNYEAEAGKGEKQTIGFDIKSISIANEPRVETLQNKGGFDFFTTLFLPIVGIEYEEEELDELKKVSGYGNFETIKRTVKKIILTSKEKKSVQIWYFQRGSDEDDLEDKYAILKLGIDPNRYTVWFFSSFPYLMITPETELSPNEKGEMEIDGDGLIDAQIYQQLGTNDKNNYMIQNNVPLYGVALLVEK